MGQRSMAMTATMTAAIAAGLAGAAWAADPPRAAALTWNAPAGCPTADAVLGNVGRILRKPDNARVPVTASARVAAAGDAGWQADLTLDVGGTRTERRFQAESCD